jgi:inner membrane protein
MATVISHAIVAGALGNLAPAGVPRLRLGVALGILAVLPGLDVIGFRFGISYGHWLGHRGFTHSILFALIAAAIMPAIAFRSVRMLTRTWWLLVGLGFTAAISHGVLDAFTDAGLGVGFLIPFDDTRYFAPWWRPLATSPLSISEFFSGPAPRILTNEALWIGPPLVGFVGLVQLVRRIRRRKFP